MELACVYAIKILGVDKPSGVFAVYNIHLAPAARQR